jgi:hypothetical protein
MVSSFSPPPGSAIATEDEPSEIAGTDDVLFGVLNNNGGRIWRWRKVDILFMVGLALIGYGAYYFRIELVVAGAGIAGIPLTQRGDKG